MRETVKPIQKNSIFVLSLLRGKIKVSRTTKSNEKRFSKKSWTKLPEIQFKIFSFCFYVFFISKCISKHFSLCEKARIRESLSSRRMNEWSACDQVFEQLIEKSMLYICVYWLKLHAKHNILCNLKTKNKLRNDSSSETIVHRNRNRNWLFVSKPNWIVRNICRVLSEVLMHQRSTTE